MPFLVLPGVRIGHSGVRAGDGGVMYGLPVRVGSVRLRRVPRIWVTHFPFPLSWHMAVPFLCCGMHEMTRVVASYWVAVRARSRTPAVVPTYMSRVMR